MDNNNIVAYIFPNPIDCNHCLLNISMCYEESENYYNWCLPLDREIEYGYGGVKFKDCPLKEV